MHQQEEIKQQQADMHQAMEDSFSELFERVGGAFLLNGGTSLGRKLSSHGLAEGITCWEPQITEPMESIPEIEAKEEPENDVPQSELPEQPKSSDHQISFRTKLADETSSPTGASLLDAMERLEKIVLDATELALRQSAVSIKNAFTDLARNQLRTHRSSRNPSKGTQREETAELHPVNHSAVTTMTMSPGNSPTQHVTIPKTSTISAASAPTAASAACEGESSKESHKFRRRPMAPSAKRMLEELDRKMGDSWHWERQRSK